MRQITRSIFPGTIFPLSDLENTLIRHRTGSHAAADFQAYQYTDEQAAGERAASGTRQHKSPSAWGRRTSRFPLQFFVRG